MAATKSDRTTLFAEILSLHQASQASEISRLIIKQAIREAAGAPIIDRNSYNASLMKAVATVRAAVQANPETRGLLDEAFGA